MSLSVVGITLPPTEILPDIVPPEELNFVFEELYAAAESGDSAAIKSIKRGADALAQAIVNVLCILDINSVVVGGGVIQSGDLYWNELDSRVQHHATFAKFIGKVDLRKSTLSKDAGLVGAALAYLDK